MAECAIQRIILSEKGSGEMQQGAAERGRAGLAPFGCSLDYNNINNIKFLSHLFFWTAEGSSGAALLLCNVLFPVSFRGTSGTSACSLLPFVPVVLGRIEDFGDRSGGRELRVKEPGLGEQGAASQV